jgi:hypothetical protein
MASPVDKSSPGRLRPGDREAVQNALRRLGACRAACVPSNGCPRAAAARADTRTRLAGMEQTARGRRVASFVDELNESVNLCGCCCDGGCRPAPPDRGACWCRPAAILMTRGNWMWQGNLDPPAITMAASGIEAPRSALTAFPGPSSERVRASPPTHGNGSFATGPGRQAKQGISEDDLSALDSALKRLGMQDKTEGPC